MTRKEFSKEITTNFTELYIEAFTNKYFQTFKNVDKFEDDFVESLSMLDKKLKDRFEKKIKKIKVVHYE